MAAQPINIEKGYVNLAFGQMHCRRLITGQKPLLLMLHQSPSASIMYVAMMQCLAEKFDLLAIDMPGFGNSDPLTEPLTLTSLTRAIKATKDQIDSRPYFVFGHHTGAALAVQLAADYPAEVKALALSGPPLLDEEQRKNLVSKAAAFSVDEAGKHLASMWQRIRAKDNRANPALSLRETLLALAAGDNYAASYQAVVDQDFAGLLGKVQCPTLVFAGDKDPLYGSVKPTLTRLPCGEEAKVSEGCGTYICESHAEEVSVLLLNFFSENKCKNR